MVEGVPVDCMDSIGYRFKNRALLEEALTTPACRMDDPDAKDNQRLEFLGDAVLGLLAADALFRSRAEAEEGELTVLRTRMVSTAALSEAAGRMGLAAALRRNRHAEELPAGSKTLADAVEALIGAAWEDGGLEAARAVFDALGLGRGAQGEAAEWASNPKGELQTRAQAMTPPAHPAYSLVKTSGPAHKPVFTVKVEVGGMGEATASAGSRKAAETAAAAALLSAVAEREEAVRQASSN